MVSTSNWEEILSGLDQAKAATLVMGKPINVQGIMLVPMVSVSGAYGTTTVLGGAGGMGIKVDPVAVVAVRNNVIDVFNLTREKDWGKLNNGF